MMSSPENREKLKLPDDINDIQIVDGPVLSYKEQGEFWAEQETGNRFRRAPRIGV